MNVTTKRRRRKKRGKKERQNHICKGSTMGFTLFNAAADAACFQMHALIIEMGSWML